MARYLFASHDGFGLGHARRNSMIAREVRHADPGAHITIVTGVAARDEWFGLAGAHIVRIPPLVKDAGGAYRSSDRGLDFDAAIAERARRFSTAVDQVAPDVVVVDRHPFGIGGELRPGIERARAHGTRAVLGLRDILDEPAVVRAELAGAGWADVPALFSDVLVYGARILCDHEREYGLPVTPTYCGWVAPRAAPAERDLSTLLIAAGGGGDGADVFRLGLGLLAARPGRRGLIAAGPYADDARLQDAVARAPSDVELLRNVADASALYARVGATVQMGGYNSTFEAIAAGLRPILVPRRTPRREQVIRAARLAALGLADVVDGGIAPEEAAWLLDRDRSIPSGYAASVGIDLDGARRAAAHIVRIAGSVRHGAPARTSAMSNA